ncbi:NAD-dependent DNA ligase LigA [Chondromyces crocatus]|uniref:DNA ligase n=1 Tax=Chondromyces crocatus TaxID=52 RepID=A0A0K1EGJ7_CHOCO|nr:NAD-dependent DNA ligase LigA [Chondromyces crocatus]AKT39807.1 DNA ligase [Chondromyces crocatus]
MKQVDLFEAHAGKHTLQGGVETDAAHRERIDDLAQRVERHRALYYAGNPEISDAAYDAIEDELRALSPTHPVLARVGSASLVTEWEKARHEIPMGSLNKVVNEDELRAWVARCEELLAKEAHSPVERELFVAEKLDGISIEVLYKDGKLVDAITRGDGEWGERITANVARMKGVPARIRERGHLSVRGEIILRLSDMKRHFPGVTSPRNMAAGLSKRFDGQGAEHCTVLFYDVAEHAEIPTCRKRFDWLRELGFGTPQAGHSTLDDVIELYRNYASGRRAALDYEIDGLVVYVDSLHVQTLLGDLNRRPRGAVAFKFASPAKVSKVLSVLWDTGPSGRVTPVAIVEPVELAGAMVQRASLHNAAHVRSLGIGVGDEVLVSRRNDVIPYVEEVVEKRGTSAQPPTTCSVCGASLVTEGEYILCRNNSCRALIEGRIHNWIDAIGALEWGDKLIEQLVAAGLVREPLDLYNLQVKDIAGLERRGEKIAKKCLDQIKNRLPLTLPVFLTALGIEGFALQTARLLVSAGYGTLDKIRTAKEAELAVIPGLGTIKAANIVRGLAARKDEIDRLIAAGIEPVTLAAEGPLASLTFCFTGSGTRPRGELTQLVESNGGRVLGSVTKELNYLILADPSSASSKAEKARKYGTKLITEEQLEQLIEERRNAAGNEG